MSVHKSGILLAAATACVGLIIGTLIGHLGSSTLGEKDFHQRLKRSSLEPNSCKFCKEEKAKNDWTLKQLAECVNATKIRNDVKELSRKPHLATTERDEELARMMRDRFLEHGFDTSELVPFNMLLSFPNHSSPNLITIKDGSSNVVFTSHYKEEELQDDDGDPSFVQAFTAYSAEGDITTEPGIGAVYVNYGRVEDFEKLDELGVDVKGHLVIARYGKIYRGNKLLHAEERGARGVILFSDPEDVAQEGVEPQEVYPDTFWLPGSGMQRGTTVRVLGDPLTPGWPATEHAYRIEEDEADLPKIPCQPIGYDDARNILEKMGGRAPPEDWVGGLEGVAYNIGPQMLQVFANYTLRLQSHNYRKRVMSYNVIGTIRGHTEPDRYVLIGNHRDAWGYGASDPASGTAQMLETARVLGELMKSGWRPRRTLVFCSWGAEEFGLLGSVEWVQERVDKLQERAVLYLNTDTCASGPIVNIPSSPLLWDTIQDITKQVPGVRNGKTIYDEWLQYHTMRNKSEIEMRTLGGGSDYGPFIYYCGIPSMDIWFRTDRNKYNIILYPAYHTGYETFYMIDNNIDPGFRITQGCSRIALLTLKVFGDSPLIPYSVKRLPEAIKNALDSFRSNGGREKLMQIYDKYIFLEEALDNFTRASSDFEEKVNHIGSYKMNPLVIRGINDQVMKLEQVLLLPGGLPGRPDTRHAIFAPSRFDAYAASGFPGIVDLLYKMDELGANERVQREKEIKRHISDLTILLQRASSLLQDFHFV